MSDIHNRFHSVSWIYIIQFQCDNYQNSNVYTHQLQPIGYPKCTYVSYRPWKNDVQHRACTVHKPFLGAACFYKRRQKFVDSGFWSGKTHYNVVCPLFLFGHLYSLMDKEMHHVVLLPMAGMYMKVEENKLQNQFSHPN